MCGGCGQFDMIWEEKCGWWSHPRGDRRRKRRRRRRRWTWGYSSWSATGVEEKGNRKDVNEIEVAEKETGDGPKKRQEEDA